MPIRFRCAYCNQLMGISHRKMGTVVRCPKCAGQVVVPQIEETPEDDASPRENEAAAVKALEDPELELLLAGAAGDASSQAKRKTKRKGPPKAILEVDVEPLDLPPLPVASEASVASMSQPVPIGPPNPESATQPQSAVVTLPRWAIGGVAGVILLLMGLAFFVGFLLGKSAAH